MSASKFTALVMAANRPGIVNPIAEMKGVSHKCLAPVAGVPMLQHVVRMLHESSCIGEIRVSIEDTSVADEVPYIRALREAGEIRIKPSGQNIFESVLAATDDMDDSQFPLLITTADNVLHFPELVEFFCKEVAKSGTDVAFGLTTKAAIERDFPDEAEHAAYLYFTDGVFSNCNTYALTSRPALAAAEAMRGGGQFGTNPLRVLQAFGVINYIIYRLRRMSLSGVVRTLGKMFGLEFRIIFVPFGEGPIDADCPRSFEVCETILQRRATEQASGVGP